MPSGNPIPAEEETNQGKEPILAMPVNDTLVPQPALPQGNPPSVQQQIPLPTSPPVLTTTRAPERLVERGPAQTPVHRSKRVPCSPQSLSPMMHGQLHQYKKQRPQRVVLEGGGEMESYVIPVTYITTIITNAHSLVRVIEPCDRRILYQSSVSYL